MFGSKKNVWQYINVLIEYCNENRNIDKVLNVDAGGRLGVIKHYGKSKFHELDDCNTKLIRRVYELELKLMNMEDDANPDIHSEVVNGTKYYLKLQDVVYVPPVWEGYCYVPQKSIVINSGFMFRTAGSKEWKSGDTVLIELADVVKKMKNKKVNK